MKIAREAWPLILPMALVILLAGALGWLVHPAVAATFWALGALLLAWAIWFFRDPDRAVPGPGETGIIVSPADGKVIKIDRAPLPKEVRQPGAAGDVGHEMERVAIFLNLFNVHVNRVPASGQIVRTSYVPGKFFNASLDKASEFNERSAAVMLAADGATVGFVQIAGLVAKRIVNSLKVGDTVRAGERFGLIRFGSRAEVYLPAGSTWLVRVGDKVVAGETVLARLHGGAPVPASIGGKDRELGAHA